MMERNPPADIDAITKEEASLPALVGAANTKLRPQNDEADRLSLPEANPTEPQQIRASSSMRAFSARSMVVAPLTRVTKQDVLIRGRWQVGINSSNLHAYLDCNPQEREEA